MLPLLLLGRLRHYSVRRLLVGHNVLLRLVACCTVLLSIVITVLLLLRCVVLCVSRDGLWDLIGVTLRLLLLLFMLLLLFLLLPGGFCMALLLLPVLLLMLLLLLPGSFCMALLLIPVLLLLRWHFPCRSGSRMGRRRRRLPLPQRRRYRMNWLLHTPLLPLGSNGVESRAQGVGIGIRLCPGLRRTP